MAFRQKVCMHACSESNTISTAYMHARRTSNFPHAASMQLAAVTLSVQYSYARSNRREIPTGRENVPIQTMNKTHLVDRRLALLLFDKKTDADAPV